MCVFVLFLFLLVALLHVRMCSVHVCACALPSLRLFCGIVLCSAEVFNCLCAHEPTLIRLYIIEMQKQHKTTRAAAEASAAGTAEEEAVTPAASTTCPVLQGIIDIVVHAESESDEEAQQYMGAAAHILMGLQAILDPSSMQELAEKDDILDVFYDDCVPLLVRPLTASLPGSRREPRGVIPTRLAVSVLHNLLDLMSFCLQVHGYRIRMYLLKNNLVGKALQLLRYTDKSLQLETITFFRMVIGTNDDFYHRHIVKNNLFAPVFKLFVENGPRYNLINSAVLELLEFIKKVGRG
jgi:Phosphatase 4 regulatory subunit 3